MVSTWTGVVQAFVMSIDMLSHQPVRACACVCVLVARANT
jgi:hypothetical protein